MNPRTEEESDVKLIVVPNSFTNLLGLKTTKALGFITINVPQPGNLGVATLRIDENAQPKVLPCGKIPLAIEDALKEELDRLVEKGVLVHKPSGKLRMCIDPQPLNEALKREHYSLPVQYFTMCSLNSGIPQFLVSLMREKLIGTSN